MQQKYDEFIKKFEEKRTTDDCFTPPEVYNAIKDWVCKRYNINPDSISRPFYPGGAYENEDYTGKVVVDNPPFSFLSKIYKFYNKHNVKFFLFCPSITCLNQARWTSEHFCAIISNSNVTYSNGANVKTGFITNLEPEEYLIRVCPDLGDAVQEAMAKINKGKKKQLKKYSYPDNLVTAARLFKIVNRNISIDIKKSEAVFVRMLDGQKEIENRSSIYGGGLLVTDEKAREIVNAETKLIYRCSDNVQLEDGKFVITLSDREREIIEKLNKNK